MISDKCESKQNLRAQNVVATSNQLKVLTKDGYIYSQNMAGETGVLMPEKVEFIASGNDFCFIKEDNTLECTSINIPAIPENTKAKKVYLAAYASTVCYIDMADKVHCLGKNHPDPQYGLAETPGILKQADYSNTQFADLRMDIYGRNACGERLSDKTTVCFSDQPINPMINNYLKPLNRVQEYALSFQKIYYIDEFGKLRANVNVNPFGSSTPLKFEHNFVLQGTKGDGRMVYSLITGGFEKENGINHLLCFIFTNKIYCSAEDQIKNEIIDLSKLKIDKPIKVTVSNNIICGIEASGVFQCTNILGESDKRVEGFEG